MRSIFLKLYFLLLFGLIVLSRIKSLQKFFLKSPLKNSVCLIFVNEQSYYIQNIWQVLKYQWALLISIAYTEVKCLPGLESLFEWMFQCTFYLHTRSSNICVLFFQAWCRCTSLYQVFGVWIEQRHFRQFHFSPCYLCLVFSGES